MTALLLATLLQFSPGIGLVDNVQARHIALSSARFAPLLVSEDEGVPRPMFDQLTREQLSAELRRLDETRPGLGGPIATLAVGVALIIPGLGITAGGLIGLIASARGTVMGFTTAAAIVLGVGFVMVTVGIILAIVGGITLGLRIKARTLNGREADEIRHRLDIMDPVPQANLVIPGPMQTVMTF